MAKEKSTHKSNHSVPNLERALVILELLANHPEGLNITQISNKIGIPKNSTFRITSTLTDKGYLFREERSKAFSLTGKLLSIGNSVISEETLLEKSIDVMRSLRDEMKETVLLGIMVNDQGIVLEQIPGLYSIKFWVDVGTVFPSNTAAPSKAIIAHMPAEVQERLVLKMEFKKFNMNTITNPRVYTDLLAKVRQLGYAVDMGEEVVGVNCVAAPIFNRNNLPIAAIWLTGPSDRISEEDIDKIGQIVKKHAGLISQRFGYYQGLE